MHIDSRQQSGDLGEARVSAALLEIGWAPPVKMPRDIGDDLLTFARSSIPQVSSQEDETENDSDLFDLSAPVLVQVKTSKKEYRKSRSTYEGREGWWFYETTSDHFDHWLRFGFPYLLVLHDEKNNKSYWAHVHHGNIIATDNSRKIFVPRDQRIERASITELNEVAVSHRAEAFSRLYLSSATLSPGQRLRHAITSPQLAIPDSGTPERLTYDQVVAMLLLDRKFEISRSVHAGVCPDPTTWRRHKGWGWQFAAALQETINGTGKSAALARLARTAPSKYERDACHVVRGCVAYIEQRFTAALTRFQPDGDSKPVDRAWLLTHRAHTFLETGDTARVAEMANTALLCLQAQTGDLSATVIRAAATTALYWAAAEDDHKQRQAAARVARAAQYNVGSLERADAVSAALATDLENRFRAWSGEQSRQLGSSGSTAHTQLTAVAWSAALSAAWDDWRHFVRQAAQITFMNSANIDEVNDALTDVTRVGASKQAKAAANHVWLNGPVEALRRNVTVIARSKWSLRAEGPAMAILASGGDLLTPSEADETIGRILTLLAKHGPIRRVLEGWTNRWSEADQALARLLYAASSIGHEKCASLIVEQLSASEGHAHAVIRVAGQLRLSDLSESTRNRLVQAAQARDDDYRASFLELLAKNIPSARTALKQLAADGDSSAARALLVAGEKSPENWKALGRQSAPAVIEMVRNATGNGQTRTFGFGGVPSLHDLALAAFHTSNSRQWKIVTDALAAGVLRGEQMDGCVRFLAGNFSELPRYVQRRLTQLAPTLHAYEARIMDVGSFDAAVFALRVAAGTLDDGETFAGLLETRFNAGADFADLIGSVPTDGREAFMLACTVDPDPHVRAQAAYGVIRLASHNPERASALAVALRKSLELNDGCRMPAGIGSAFRDFAVEGFDEVRDELMNHPSAVVRRLVSLRRVLGPTI